MTTRHHIRHHVITTPIDVDEREIRHVLDELAYDDESAVAEIMGGEKIALEFSDLLEHVINATRA